MLKLNKFIIIILFPFYFSYAVNVKKTYTDQEIIKLLKVSKLEEKKSFYLIKLASKRLFKSKNQEVSKALIIHLNLVTQKSPLHFHFEYFIPLYKKNKTELNKLIKKTIQNKKEREFFMIVLQTALDEDTYGNDH